MKNLLFGTAALFFMASCSGNGGSEKTKEDSAHIEATRDSLLADSIAQAEGARQAEDAAKAAAEQARLDSIRQDSIAKEIEMNLGQLSFISHKGDWKKILPKFGFKLTSKKTYTQPSDYEEDATWEITDYVYNRNLNGRKVTFKFDIIYERGPEYEGEFGKGYCATMIIHDQNEKKKFLQDVKKLNKMKEYEKFGNIWKASNIDHYIRYSGGEIIFDTDH